MNALIPDIETLKKVVKTNASLPYESIEPYIEDALDIYIEPYIGHSAINKAKEDLTSDLYSKLLRALGPLTLMLATDELGIMFGDSGITVSNVQGQRSPASDAKIAAAKTNLCFRGMQALDRLISYLEKNQKDFPDYVANNNTRFCFIRTAQEFQDLGMVDIDYSILSYRIMYSTIRQLQERNVREMIPDKVYEGIKEAFSQSNTTPKQQVLIDYIIRFLANKTAELYTSQKTTEQRVKGKAIEYAPTIRPVYQDPDANGNFFANQATYYAGKIHAYLIENAEELGVETTSQVIDFNSKEKKLFTSIS
jgi:hypothetical protein